MKTVYFYFFFQQTYKMAGWRGAGNGEKSVVGLYEWTNNAYRVLSSSFAAPMPGNIWFSMIVRVVDNKVTVLRIAFLFCVLFFLLDD